MKKTNKVHRHISAPAYPNAASSRYFLGKLVNALTAIASCSGILTVLLFFFLL